MQIGGAQSLGKCSLCRPERLVKGRKEGIGTALDPGANHLTKVFHAAGKRMLATNHQPMDPLMRELSHTEADPPTHGVTPEVGLFDPSSIKNGDDISDARFQ